jgi:hypothetical protein
VRWHTVMRLLAALEATQHQLADELEAKGARVRWLRMMRDARTAARTIGSG